MRRPASLEAVGVEMGRGQTQVEVEVCRGANAKGFALHLPDGSRTRWGGPSSGSSASVSAASVPEMAGVSAGFADCDRRVCPALVSVASPNVNESAAPLTSR